MYLIRSQHAMVESVLGLNDVTYHPFRWREQRLAGNKCGYRPTQSHFGGNPPEHMTSVTI
jgi:hypothetical protein